MKVAFLPKLFQPYQCDDIVRLGKNNDGGYLVNIEDVVKTKTLLSFGVGMDVSFERDFTRLNDCDVIAYDGTVGNVHSDFFKGNRVHIRKNVGPNSFDKILGMKEDVFLSCDIEEAEYDILYNILGNAERFSGISMEFHRLFKHENFNELTNFISKLDLKLIHVHANNYSYAANGMQCAPYVVELSFTSSKNIKLNRHLTLPHKLDMPNNPDDDEIKIQF